MINNIGITGVNEFTHPQSAEVIGSILMAPKTDLMTTITNIKLVVDTALAAYKAARSVSIAELERLGMDTMYREGFNTLMTEKLGAEGYKALKSAINGWRCHALFRAVCADEAECDKRALTNALRWF